MRKTIFVAWCVAAIVAGFVIGPIEAQDRANPDLVIIKGRVYELVPYGGPAPAPAPSPEPWPQPDVPAPRPEPQAPDAIPPPADALQKKARDYMYVIPAYHRQVAREVRSFKLKTNPDVGKRGMELRDMVGNPFGAMVNDAIRKSGSLDANGNIIDVDKYAKIFESIADSQSAVLKQVNP